MTCAYTVALCTHNHADRLLRTLADVPGTKPFVGPNQIALEQMLSQLTAAAPTASQLVH